MYEYVTPAPPPNTSTPKKRKCPAQQDEDGPYVKKPPNAFMLYLKEQRPKVIAELNIPGSAAVNAVVGQRWKSLSNDQKPDISSRLKQKDRIMPKSIQPGRPKKTMYVQQ
ncbi:transcription factor 7-like 1-B [Maylandia zebra]|uniref:transcription factor 7-like 1-B n=1 Tax=Maylandia zebra TaxID=106582 RepID=UPI000D3034CB|nr:transcription factor 7-like 1-B [Maylandia zebra]